MYGSKFQVYKDRAGQFRWRLVAANNEIVAISEAYTTLYGAQHSANRVKQIAAMAIVVNI